MDVRFQTAGVSDIPVIQRLSEHVWRSHYPGIITLAQIDHMLAKMYARDVIGDEIDRQRYRYAVVSDQNEPIGYLAFRHDDKTASILLSKIYLLPIYHGKGIGRQMLQYVKNEAAKLGAKTIQLFVNKNNTNAIRAYERFGFVKEEAIVTDIGGGFVMDDFILALELPGV
ncbi:MAG TPA: GNAT family N-acetyltransferase [Nitrospirota bacterium]|nr:GNAT family N-acetyltransferase [Nitrospirota bacterium]